MCVINIKILSAAGCQPSGKGIKPNSKNRCLPFFHSQKSSYAFAMILIHLDPQAKISTRNLLSNIINEVVITCLTQTDTYWLAGSRKFLPFSFSTWQPESTNLFSFPLFFGKVMQIITFGMFYCLTWKKCHAATFRHLATGRFLFGVGTFIAFCFSSGEGEAWSLCQQESDIWLLSMAIAEKCLTYKAINILITKAKT